MKPYLLILALSFLAMSAAYADEKYYRNDGTEIRYYLDNAEAENLLVVFQGSDCNSVRHMESVNKNMARVCSGFSAFDHRKIWHR